MSSRLFAAQDLRALPYASLVSDLRFTSLLEAGSATNGDNSVWRSLSNVLQAEWPDAALPSAHSWWAPRRSDAKALAGSRALSVGNSSNGGNLAIGSAVAAIAAATRPLTILERSGAQRQEVSGVADAVFPEWRDSGQTGYWVGEATEVPDQVSLSASTVSCTPKTVGTTIELSRRLVKQALNIEAQVAAELQRLVRSTVESALLTGTGTNGEPMGLFNVPGTAVSVAGAVPTAAELREVLDSYLAEDGDPDAAAWYVHPAMFVDLMATELVSTSGVFAASITPTGRAILGIRAFVSNHVPADRIALLNPANVTVTHWRSPIVMSNPYALDTTGGLRLTVLDDVDVAARHVSQVVIGG